MDLQSNVDNQQRARIVLEIVPEDDQDAEPALLSEVGRSIVYALRDDGYIVKPLPTGQRGVLELLFVVITFFESVGGEIWSHRDILDTLSALCTIFGTVSPIVMHLLKASGKQISKDNKQDSLIKVAIKINGAEISVESSDLETDERIVALAERFIASYPATSSKITPQSEIKIKGYVPKRKPRRRN